jgi:hypothetical protein
LSRDRKAQENTQIQIPWSDKETILTTSRRLVLPPAFAQKSYDAHMKLQKASPNILVLSEGYNGILAW